MSEFNDSVDQMPDASKIFVDKSLQIADRVFQLLLTKGINQKELADRMGKTEAEVSRLLQGMYNMTLRTLSNLEAALQSDVIVIPSAQHYGFYQLCPKCDGEKFIAVPHVHHGKVDVVCSICKGEGVIPRPEIKNMQP